MPHSTLFTPLRIGDLELPNRIVMAPLTRMRADNDGRPTKLTVEYYQQRSSAGLIITEGTAVSRQAHGYPNAPGIYTPGQIASWREVTDAVHARGGRIIMQIAHNGRNSHSSFNPNGSLPVSSSAVPPTGPVLTSSFQQVPPEVPVAIETADVPFVINCYKDAALNAVAAGFDGVELQGANSHLIDQFLQSGTNQRTDQYGGAVENRARFLLEIVDEVSNAIGTNKLGVRLSPFGQYGGISDAAPFELFKHVIGELSNRKIAYLHLIEARGSEIGLSDELHDDGVNNAELFRSAFDGPLISAAAYSPESAAMAVESGAVDAVAFGRLFIANPDLPFRISLNASLNKWNRATFYGGGAEGYVDYPKLPGL